MSIVKYDNEKCGKSLVKFENHWFETKSHSKSLSLAFHKIDEQLDYFICISNVTENDILINISAAAQLEVVELILSKLSPTFSRSKLKEVIKAWNRESLG